MHLGVEILTAADADARQRHLAGGLLAAGLRAGDRVALVATSGADLLCCALGALRVGIVPVLTHAGLLPSERAELLADADPGLVVDDAVLAGLAAAPPTDLAPAPLARPMHYTSGTTGRAKGVWSGLLDEHDAAALLDEEVALWGFGPADRHLVCSPLYHSVAVRWAGATLLSGGTVILPGPFDAALAADAIARHAPTTAFLVPAHLQRLFSLPELPPLDGFRLVAHAGSACPEPLKLAATDAFGEDALWEFYGSTEGQFTAVSSPEWRERPGTVGRARPGRTLEVDPDGTIWCEVPRWARFEYWRDRDKTRAAWRPAAADPGAIGAFTVGDLGRLDADGYLFLDGRRDDLIITGGVNVYPAEVERVLATAAGVREVAVVGVDDERWGQRVCAAVVGDTSPAALDAFAREHLAGHKRPKDYLVVDSLPHTATGKLRRNVVADEHFGS
ncbi:MAG: class I adenylate-forming enzyme family protein [Microthrixaceae bacterium]